MNHFAFPDCGDDVLAQLLAQEGLDVITVRVSPV